MGEARRSGLGRRRTGLAVSIGVVLEVALAMVPSGPSLGAEAAAAKSPPAAAAPAAPAIPAAAVPANPAGPATPAVPTATPSAASEARGNGPKLSEKAPATAASAAKTRADVAKRLTAVRKATDRGNAAGAAADGPSSPPLDIGALRAEAHRESHRSTELDATELPETKVEKMLAEVAKAREALHADTLKLEALVAAAALKPAPAPNPDDEGADDAAKSDGRPRAEGEAGAAAGGKPATKNPQDILAKALRGIKPEQAAPIVTRLDPQLAAAVLQRMPPADAGKILAAMKADSAAQLATLIAARKPRGDARSTAAPAAAERPTARPPAVAAPGAAAPTAGGAPNAEGAPPVATSAPEAGK